MTETRITAFRVQTRPIAYSEETQLLCQKRTHDRNLDDGQVTGEKMESPDMTEGGEGREEMGHQERDQGTLPLADRTRTKVLYLTRVTHRARK